LIVFSFGSIRVDLRHGVLLFSFLLWLRLLACLNGKPVMHTGHSTVEGRDGLNSIGRETNRCESNVKCVHDVIVCLLLLVRSLSRLTPLANQCNARSVLSRFTRMGCLSLGFLGSS